MERMTVSEVERQYREGAITYAEFLLGVMSACPPDESNEELYMHVWDAAIDAEKAERTLDLS